MKYIGYPFAELPKRSIAAQTSFQCKDKCFKDVIELDDVIEKWNEAKVEDDDDFCTEKKADQCQKNSIRFITSSPEDADKLTMVLIASGASALGVLLMCGIAICICRYRADVQPAYKVNFLGTKS